MALSWWSGGSRIATCGLGIGAIPPSGAGEAPDPAGLIMGFPQPTRNCAPGSLSRPQQAQAVMRGGAPLGAQVMVCQSIRQIDASKGWMLPCAPVRSVGALLVAVAPGRWLRVTLALLLGAIPAVAQLDPSGAWRTLHTPHFRVHFRSTYRDVAVSASRGTSPPIAPLSICPTPPH